MLCKLQTTAYLVASKNKVEMCLILIGKWKNISNSDCTAPRSIGHITIARYARDILQSARRGKLTEPV